MMRDIWRQAVVGVESAVMQRDMERPNDWPTSTRFLRIQVLPRDPGRTLEELEGGFIECMPDTSPTPCSENVYGS
jgi:hypothetical protein